MPDSLQRVDRVSGPLVVGQFYLVRTVRGSFFGKVTDWPVIGPEHDDREIFNFSIRHYHIDARFLRGESITRTEGATQGAILSARPPESPELPDPVWKRRKCANATFGFNIPWNRKVDPLYVLRSTFAGTQCARNAGGWVCPHRQAPLGSIVPVEGIITCPLHGLRINAATGVCLTASSATGPAKE